MVLTKAPERRRPHAGKAYMEAASPPFLLVMHVKIIPTRRAVSYICGTTLCIRSDVQDSGIDHPIKKLGWQ